MALTLYVLPPSPRSFKVLALAAHLELECTVRIVDMSAEEHRSASYTALNPNQRMPAIDDDGFTLWEANAIVQYLALKRPDSGLLPSDDRQRARVLQWQCWDLAHWEPACTPLLYERCVKALFGLGEPDPRAVQSGLAAFAKVAPVLDAQLASNEFVAGSQLTVADFSLGAILNLSDMAGLPIGDYPHMLRWHQRLMQLPAWRAALVTPPCNRADSSPRAA